ncbi:MAG: type IV-A pilus assembly ATPase PilB, partial [Pseudomonadota bacterium]
GLFTREQALAAAEEAAREEKPLVTYLVSSDLVAAGDIARLAAAAYGVPMLDLSAVDTSVIPKDLVSTELVRRHRALPLAQRGPRVFIAVSDPTNFRSIEEIRFHTGLMPEIVLVEDTELGRRIDELFAEHEIILDDISEEELQGLDEIGAEGNKEEGETKHEASEDAPVVRYINKILLDAILREASDIHFEPYDRFYRIRYRQDGLLHDVAAPPVGVASRFASRLKVMARLNIAERRIPQDGRVRLQLSKNRHVDFRVNTCPTLHGEKIVMRILESSFGDLDITALGMTTEQEKLFLKALEKPYGMILVTGPTGSGKSVTLYSGVKLLNNSDVNISTVEDPVEIQMAGINQVNINMKAGLDFAGALRAFLRQDPDIIMVGEVRDLETAEIAVKAAQTGHLVLSTLHTNDAPQSLTRLANMGVPAYNIASSVLLIMAQRLARKLCDHCKAEDEIPREALLQAGFPESEVDEGFTLYKPVGCDRCTQGYRGRIGIFQVMPVSPTIERLILENGTSAQLADQARTDGTWDLRRAGLEKVKLGITSLEEISRVTKD